MAWAEVESYRQLEQDYEQALKAYQESEKAYREAARRDDSDPTVQEQYEALAAKRRELEGLYDRLRELRTSVAQAREEAPRKVAL